MLLQMLSTSTILCWLDEEKAGDNVNSDSNDSSAGDDDGRGTITHNKTCR
jgi:hypothetical protein